MATKTEKNRQPLGSPSYNLHGIALPASSLKALEKRGIYCVPGVSVEHQHVAKRYVLRGVESGGAVADMGRACAFVFPGWQAYPLATVDRYHCGQRKTRGHPCGKPGQDRDDESGPHLRTHDHFSQLVDSIWPYSP